MKSWMLKGIAIFLFSGCMICAAVICFALCEPIKAGESFLLTLSCTETYKFIFKPEISGEYALYTEGNVDTYGIITDENDIELARDDDGGNMSNFYISYNFVKNTSYYFLISCDSQQQYQDEMTVTVCLDFVQADEEHTHSYEYAYTVEPDCTHDGEIVSRCICGDKSVELIAMKGHDFITTIITEPTCTQKGKSQSLCKSCGSNRVDTIDALGHFYPDEWTVDKAATCTAQGSKSHRCTRCDKRTDVTVIPSLGHSYSTKWTIDQKSSLSGAGSKSHHCTRCSAKTASTTIPKVMSVVLSSTVFAYNGSDRKPSVTVKDSKGNKLRNSIDYTVKYPSDMKNVSAKTVTVTFKGNYSGSKSLKYKILPTNIKTLDFTCSETSVTLKWSRSSGASRYRIFKYNNETKKYTKIADTTKLSYTLKGLKSGTDYVFAVRAYKISNNITYYSERSTKISAATVPSAPTLKVKSSSRSAQLSWNKKACNGYIIYMYSPNTNKYNVIRNIKGNTVVSYKKTNLAKGKTYYFKMRAYKTVAGKTIYSPYSKVVSVKIR